MLAIKVEREITKINYFEKKWKIKTNTNKFTVIPLAIKKTHPITINGVNKPYSKEGKILGMNINTQGIHPHIKHTKRTALAAITTIKRFYKLSTKIEIHLVKACVLPIITYPTYPLCAMSKTTVLSLQKIQNKALRFAYNEKYPYTKNAEQMHQLSNLKPINVMLYNRGDKIRQKLMNTLHDEAYNTITTDNNTNSHTWFKKPYVELTKNPPAELYTSSS